MTQRFYCTNCFQYLRLFQVLSAVEVTTPRPARCENAACQSGFTQLFPFEVPDQFPDDLSNPLIEATHDQLAGPGPGYKPSPWRRLLQWLGIACLTAAMTLSAAPNPLNIFRCAGCERDADGKIKRSRAKAKRFLREIGWTLPTRDIRVDHIIPLACGPASGAYDDLGNMQLQTLEEAATKDRWERDSAACSPSTQAAYLAKHGQLMPNAHSRSKPAPWVYERVELMKSERKGKR